VEVLVVEDDLSIADSVCEAIDNLE